MSGLAETNTSTLQEQHTMSDTTKTPKIETVDIRVPVSWVYVYDDILQKGGQVFRHYKDHLYRVVRVATHTETMQKLVVYYPLAKPNEMWARPYDMFVGNETVNGRTVKRFTLMKIHNV